MHNYIIPLCDDEHIPWIKIIRGTDINDAKDKIIDYILNEYDFDGIKYPLDYAGFVDKCRKLDIYIGNIREIDELC